MTDYNENYPDDCEKAQIDVVSELFAETYRKQLQPIIEWYRDAVIPIFRQMMKSIHIMLIQTARGYFYYQLLDKGLPDRVSKWVAKHYPESWLPAIWDDLYKVAIGLVGSQELYKQGGQDG